MMNQILASQIDVTFQPEKFVENLKYMGAGMLAIFAVIGVIIGVTCLLNWATKPRKKNDQSK